MPDVRAVTKAYFDRPDVRERKNSVRRVDTNPARREVNFRGNLAKYGVTPDQHAAMMEAQGNRCIICGNPPKPDGVRAASRLHIDHDHVTGKIRDLICNHCNRGVGALRDDPALMRAAAEYIERHRAVT